MSESADEVVLNPVSVGPGTGPFPGVKPRETLAGPPGAARRYREDPSILLATLRATASTIPDAVIGTDLGGCLTFMNRAAETLIGWSTEEAEGRRLTDVIQIFDERSGLALENPVETVLRGGSARTSPHLIATLITRHGVSIPIEAGAVSIRDDRETVHGAILTFRDIAQRRRTEEGLREGLADFFENAAIGIHWVSPDGTILRANRAELELLGYSRDEFVGHNIAEFHLDRWVADEVLERLRAGEELREHEARLRCKDGTVKHVVITSNVRRKNGVHLHTCRFTRDITDRKRVEEAQARLAAIVESSRDAIISKNAHGQIVSWNAAASRLFGYSSHEAIGRPITMLIPPDRHDEETMILDRLRRGEVVEHYETVRLTKDGRLVDIALTISPIRDSLGRFTGASKIARDITAAKRTEVALRQSEIQFRLLANALPQIVWTARPDGSVDYYNDRWYDYVGADSDNVGDPGWIAVLHPDHIEDGLASYHASIRDGTPYEAEYRFRDRSTGGYRWFLGRAFPVRDEGHRIIRWFGTWTDIDDRKRAEEAARFLAEASAALTDLTDSEGLLQRVAALAVPAFADWCAVDLLARDGSIRRVTANHRDPAQGALVDQYVRNYPWQSDSPHGVAKVLRTGTPEWVPLVTDQVLEETIDDPGQLEMAKALGIRSYLCVPICCRGATIGALTFATADSGRIYRADDVAAAEDLADRTAIAIENGKLLDELKDADRRKNEFLAILAHELRNPLAPIRNAAQIIRVKSPPVAEVQWAREVIERQVHQMTRLVDDLLDISRITQGKIELRRQPIELAAVVASAVEASRPLIEQWRHELIVTLPAEPIVLDADLTRLSQVLLNLLNNAAKYSNQGGRIELIASRTNQLAEVRVKDNGIGIPEEMLPHIFEMFTQVNRSLERAQEGLGIGLTLVKLLVEMHGGTIEARSGGEKRGSEFIVRLPLAGPPQARADQREDDIREQINVRKQRILIVDDNKDAADSLGMLLQMTGSEVQTANDGLEAVDTAARFKPDVVFMDIGLPKMSGYDAAKLIREDQGSEVVLVAVTGWGQEEDRLRSRTAGFDHHLTKPVDLETLQRLLAATRGDEQRSRPEAP